MKELMNEELENQYKNIFKTGMIEMFEFYLKEKMEEKEFSSYPDAQKRLTIQMAIVTVWKYYYNTDFSQFTDETNLSDMVLKDIICEVREEMINNYR